MFPRERKVEELKRFLNLFLIFNLVSAPVWAYSLDTSVDEEIRKNYNPSKIEQDTLPSLPQNLKEEPNTVEVNRYTSEYKTQSQSYQPVKTAPHYTSKVSVDGNYAVFKKGTKFKTKLMSGISDRTSRGTSVRLMNKYPVSTTYFTIPIGAIFEGTVVRSHPPQFTGNGGHILLRIDKVIINDVSYSLSARVIEANYKNIFFNSMKGQRKYVKNMFSSMRPGFQYFKRMSSTAARLLNDGGAAFWSPFPFAAGILVLGANVMVSPALAVFSKGGPMYLRGGSNIEIKLSQDALIYN